MNYHQFISNIPELFSCTPQVCEDTWLLHLHLVDQLDLDRSKVGVEKTQKYLISLWNRKELSCVNYLGLSSGTI